MFSELGKENKPFKSQTAIFIATKLHHNDITIIGQSLDILILITFSLVQLLLFCPSICFHKDPPTLHILLNDSTINDVYPAVT